MLQIGYAMSEGEKLEKDLESLGLDALSLKNVTAASEKKNTFAG